MNLTKESHCLTGGNGCLTGRRALNRVGRVAGEELKVTLELGFRFLGVEWGEAGCAG